MTECLFCKIQEKGYEDEIAYENEYFIATRDTYPVSNSGLIIPKRHFASYFDMNVDEQASVHQILKHQRDEILSIDSTVEAFNIGTNDGTAAGQSIFHLHIHLFPRRFGDIENPRGGVRGVIPAKQKYTKK